MKITFLGATGTVTGSKYLIESGTQKVLVDCGLFQGLKELRLRNWSAFPVDPKELSAVILTHAHIDHTGYLPLLCKRGFRGPIYCTTATRDLCRVLLPDSGRLQEEEASFAEKMGYSKHRPPLPLYTQEDAERCLKQLHPIPFDNDFDLTHELKLRLIPSGHILGSAFVKLTEETTTILFTGDLGRPNDLVLRPPRFIENTDYLVVESTYGDRLHEPESPIEQIEKVVNRVTTRGGVIVVPAFSVGRTQSLLYALYELKKAHRIPDLPVFLNSPMSVSSQHIFCAHLGEHRLTPKQCEGMCGVAHYVNSPDESKSLNHRTSPMILISASGMITGGRVLHHLKAFAPDPKNMILLTGYQATGTRGAALLGGAKSIKIHGQQIPVGAEVAVLHDLSAHADQSEILSWLSHFKTAPKMTFITHGEPFPAQALKGKIEKELHWPTRVPEYLERTELT